MIDIKKLKEIVNLMVKHELTEMDLEGDGEKVRLRRAGPQQEPHVVYSPPPQSMAPHAPAVPGASPASPAATESPAPEPPEAQPGTIAIKSKLVGTFYAAPSPDAKPYVQIGEKVTPDTVVCIIEAMKVFNELKAEVSGTVEKVLVENGQAVEFGQDLFLLRPA